MDDFSNLIDNLPNDPDYIKFIQDPTTGLLSRMGDIMDKKNMPIEEYREIEKQKTAEMQADYLKSKGLHPETTSPSSSSRFGRSGKISSL
jgi:hypothetical protein